MNIFEGIVYALFNSPEIALAIVAGYAAVHLLAIHWLEETAIVKPGYVSYDRSGKETLSYRLYSIMEEYLAWLWLIAVIFFPLFVLLPTIVDGFDLMTSVVHALGGVALLVVVYCCLEVCQMVFTLVKYKKQD